VVRVDAGPLFMRELAGIRAPEQKRTTIGRPFVDVFKAEAQKLKASGGADIAFLAQGTISPDVIESGASKNAKKAVTIKSHHNVGGLPEQLGLELLEPLRDLFKDEVRELGIALGLPPEMVYRHPFPARAWAYVSWARSSRNTPTCCAAPTPSSSRSCAPASTRRPARAGTSSRARPSPSSCP